MSQQVVPEVDLGRWYVCPVQPVWAQTKTAFLDRTPGFLVCTSIAEIALALAQSAGPEYEFTGETIPFKDYVPGLSVKSMIADLRRWLGFMNPPNLMPLGTVVPMD